MERNLQVIYPPNFLSIEYRSVFLAGSIEMGKLSIGNKRLLMNFVLTKLQF